MNNVTRKLSKLGVGAKLSAISFILITIVFGIFVWATGQATSNMLEQRAAEEVTAKSKLVVGMSNDVALIKSKLLSLKVGTTGGYYVLDANTGADYGKLIIAAKKEGQNVLADKATDGREYIKEILSKKDGVIHYRSAADAGAPERVAAFTYVQDKNWVVVGDTYANEFTREATALRNMSGAAALLALLILAALLYTVIRKTVTGPLGQATKVARQLASGDLTARLETKRMDEIGHLLSAINGIGQGLSLIHI